MPPRLPVVDASVWATSLLAVAVRCVFCGFCVLFIYLFILSSQLYFLWDSKTPHRPACERVSYCVETSSRFPPQDRSLSLTLFFFFFNFFFFWSLTLLSLFLSFIFCPTSFQREWAAFWGAWCPLPVFRSFFVEVAQHSNDLLMNL